MIPNHDLLAWAKNKKYSANRLSIDLLISNSHGPSMYNLSIYLLLSNSHCPSMYNLSIDLLLSNSHGPSMYNLSIVLLISNSHGPSMYTFKCTPKITPWNEGILTCFLLYTGELGFRGALHLIHSGLVQGRQLYMNKKYSVLQSDQKSSKTDTFHEPTTYEQLVDKFLTKKYLIFRSIKMF